MSCSKQLRTLGGFSDELGRTSVKFLKPVPPTTECSVCGLVDETTFFFPCGQFICKTCYPKCALASLHAFQLNQDDIMDGEVRKNIPRENITARPLPQVAAERSQQLSPPGDQEVSYVKVALIVLGVIAVSSILGLLFMVLDSTDITESPKTGGGGGGGGGGTGGVTVPTSESSTIRPTEKVASFCQTDSCVFAANSLKSTLNTAVAPCDNFDEHVCGRLSKQFSSVQEQQYNPVRQAQFTSVLALGAEINQLEDARMKVARLLRSCFKRWDSPVKQHDELRKFLVNESLNFTEPPAGMSTTPEDLLALHVHLAFDYLLGGLISIGPGDPGFLLTTLTDEPRRRWDAYQASSDVLEDYMRNLATVQDVTLTQELFENMTNLQEKAYTTLMAGLTNETQSTIRFLRKTTADVVEIEGLDPQAFANAVSAKTPYLHNSGVFIDFELTSTLGYLWRELSPLELYQWTSWNVLDQCGRYVDSSLRLPSLTQEELDGQCMHLMKALMPVPLAALTMLNT